MPSSREESFEKISGRKNKVLPEMRLIHGIYILVYIKSYRIMNMCPYVLPQINTKI